MDRDDINEFLEFIQQHRISPSSNTKLMVLQIENHSSNDFYREMTQEEQEQLIQDFLNKPKI